jgi:thiol-disulfide isomerase/thioredoxin
MFDRLVSRRTLGLLSLGGVAALATSAQARQNFDDTAFRQAQSAGRTIFIEVSAPWCPVCRAQQPIINSLMQTDQFRNAVLFNIDFDSQRELLRRFNVRQQSTLIVFKGGEERARSTGDTDPGAIRTLFARGL